MGKQINHVTFLDSDRELGIYSYVLVASPVSLTRR
jgi:hypothetical protein